MHKRPLYKLASGLALLVAAVAAQGQSAYFQAVTNLNPAAYWPLQETVPPPGADVETNLGSLGAVANAFYSSTNAAHLATGVTGDGDAAVNFLSSSNGGFLAVPLTSGKVVVPAGAFTVEVWVYPTNYTASTIIAQTGPAGTGGLNGGTNSAGWSLNLGYLPSLNLTEAGTFSFHVYNGVGATGGAEAIFGQSSFSVNNWYHVVGVFDGTNAVIYVNDVAGTSFVPLNGTQALDTWDPLTIGCGRELNNNRFGGAIDEPAVYTYALSATQVGNHYSAVHGSSYASTVLGDHPYMYWRMDAPFYTAPAASAYPAAANLGSANAGGVYFSGVTPGVAGPAYAGFGSLTNAVAFNGIGTDATNNIPVFTNGVPALTGAADSGILITNTDPSLNLTNQNITAMVWFKANPADDRFQGLIGRGNSSWRLSLDGTSGKVHFNPGPGGELTSTRLYNDGQWHFAAGVYASAGAASPAGWLGTNSLYVDGELDTTTTFTNSATLTTVPCLIGGAPDYFGNGNGDAAGYSQRFFSGSLAHAAYFTNALTGAQIANLYASATAAAVPPPFISGQPVTGRTVAGGPGTFIYFGVNAGGTPALTYQWYYNSSSNYAGATALVDNVTHYTNSETLQVTVTNLAASDSGYYYVVVGNSFGSVTSILASLTVDAQPVITSQTPAGGTLSLYQNQNYTLSVGVTGETNFTYQWLTNGVADTTAGTGSTYLLTSVQAAVSGNTYQCVITNVAGAATNALVTLHVLSLPAALTGNPYSSNVLALNPSAYWPMHEVAAAATGDVETNLGLLGNLANGYYADWVVDTNIDHQVTGALAGDSDTAVLFNNVPDGTYPGYLIIPRTVPATTLQAPLTLEAWVKPTSSGFGDIISQGAFNANANGSTSGSRYGVRMCWGVNTGGTNSSDFITYVGPGTGTGNPAYPSTVNPVLPIGQWYHVALATPDGTNWTLYVNGNVHAAFALPMGVDTGDPLLVGQGLWESTGPQRAFPGAIDEVAIYTNALSQTSIQTHYNDGINGPAGQYKADVLALGPVVYLRMDGPAYTPPPASTWPVLTNYGTVGGNGVYSPGSLPGAVAGPSELGLSAGKNVMPGNGMSSFADAGFNPAFNPTGATPFSFGAWFRGNPADARTLQTIIGHSDNSFSAALTSAGKLQAHAGGGTLITSPTVLNDGNWHQFIVTYTGTNTTYNSTNTGTVGISTLYVDGAQAGQSTGGANAGTNLDVLIGDDPEYTNNPVGPGRSLAGQVCEAAFWSGVTLSSSQAVNLYNNSGTLPAISAQPVTNRSVNGGTNTYIYFGVVAGGSGPLNYQWYYNSSSTYTGATALVNGAKYSLATTAQVTVTNLAGSDSGYYFVVISNNFGSTTSILASLTVYAQPSVAAQYPVPYTNPFTLFAGANPTFSVVANGALPLTYRWYTNGVLDTSATGSSLTLTNVQASFANTYCVVSNFVSTATSLPWAATVIPAPTAPYPLAVMAAKPIGYWRLNEGPDNGAGDQGAISHDYAGGNDGIYTNATLGQMSYDANTDPTATSTEFGETGISFYDSYAGQIAGIDFAVPTNNSATFTIEAWVNGFAGSETANGAGIVAKGYGGGGEQFDLDVYNNEYRFFVRDASGAVHGPTSTLKPDGGWHHLVGVCDEVNSNVSLYVDGSLAGTGSVAPGAGILEDTLPMSIGSRPSAANTNYNNQFYGFISDVAVYNYALSAGQVGAQFVSAGVPPLIAQGPAVSITNNGDAPLTIPVTALGTAPLLYIWYDTAAGTNVVTGLTNASPLNATLTTVGNVPLTWNNDTLQLTVSNAYGMTNISVALTILTNAPLIASDLSPQVTVASGKAYDYAIGVAGPTPYGYQWYNGATLISGQTNSSYTLTAGSPGSTTYYVVITNVFGASTSSVSTFTSVAVPANAYAAAIFGLNPAGYWPLQETNAPAPVTMETNYGRLGALGNAYYSATNASVVAFGQGGALQGDSDPAVAFGAVGQVSYAFVPRVSPALTIQAPFSVEAWVNPSNSTYGIIVGEGGGTGLNGATAFGGFQMGFGADEAQMQYYTGGNNTYNMFASPANYPVQTWYHVVSTYDGTNSSTYVNGTLVVTGTTPNTPDRWSPLVIGNGKWVSTGGERQLSAVIDEVAVYTNVLTPARISAHYNAGIDPVDNGAYETNVLADQPMLYYHMDCAGYTNPPESACPEAVNFGSVLANGAYLAGVVPGGVSGPPNLALGTNSLAAPINGLISCVDAGVDPAFNPVGTNAFTAMCWFAGNPADGRVQTIMGHGITNWAMNLDGTTGRVVWNLYNGGQVTSTNILNDGNWHFAAGVYNGTTSSLYVDGKLNSSATAAAALVSEPNVHLYLGGNADYVLVGNNERYLAGAIAQAAFYTNALTATQINQIYTAAAGSSAPPVVSIKSSGSNVVITYTGTLESATSLNGTFNPVTGASSPYTTPATNAQVFYRTQQ